MDEPNFPHAAYKKWKDAGKKILISVGGQFGNWHTIFASDKNIQNFVDSLVDLCKRFKLDGVDLDIESYGDRP